MLLLLLKLENLALVVVNCYISLVRILCIIGQCTQINVIRIASACLQIGANFKWYHTLQFNFFFLRKHSFELYYSQVKIVKKMKSDVLTFCGWYFLAPDNQFWLNNNQDFLLMSQFILLAKQAVATAVEVLQSAFDSSFPLTWRRLPQIWRTCKVWKSFDQKDCRRSQISRNFDTKVLFSSSNVKPIIL